MNLCLIQPRIREWNPNVWVPLGLTYIAASLENDGHNVTIIDLNVEKMNKKDLRKRIQGFEAVGITGMITEYQKVADLAATVRQISPRTIIILGGPLATTLPAELLESTEANYVVIGEGERVTSQLIKSIEGKCALSEVDGIVYKKNGHIIFTKTAKPINDLDSLPFPARHLLNMKKYIKNHFETFGYKIEGYEKIRSTNLISSRGCPYDCTFCFKGMWGCNWRGRSAENMVDEIECLVNDYDINGLFFNDDTFVLDKKRVFEFTRLLKARNLDVIWECNGRVNLMQKDLLKAMFDAGCRGVAYGIESGNQSILNKLNKGITLNQIENVIKWTKDTGLKTSGYFMIGILDDTKETITDTISFARKLDLDFYSFSVTTPFPGTKLFEEAAERGLLSTNKLPLKEWDFGVNVNLTKDCTDTEILTFKNQIFREFTLIKQFGKRYYVNPLFVRESLKVILSIRSKDEAKRLASILSHLIK